MNNRFSIVECEKMAKDEGFDTATFELCGLAGKKKCKWIDAYMGMFEIENVSGFLTTGQIKGWGNVWCENFQANKSQEVTP